MEPFLGGQLLGELGNYYDMPTGVEVIAYTQEQFDQMCEEFYEEHGHYPDQWKSLEVFNEIFKSDKRNSKKSVIRKILGDLQCLQSWPKFFYITSM